MNYLAPVVLTTNTTTASEDWSGKGSLFAVGTFGGGTVTLQYSPDAGVTWLDAKNDAGVVVSITSSDVINFDVGNCKVRGKLAGSAGASVTFYIVPR